MNNHESSTIRYPSPFVAKTSMTWNSATYKAALAAEKQNNPNFHDASPPKRKWFSNNSKDSFMTTQLNRRSSSASPTKQLNVDNITNLTAPFILKHLHISSAIKGSSSAKASNNSIVPPSEKVLKWILNAESKGTLQKEDFDIANKEIKAPVNGKLFIRIMEARNFVKSSGQFACAIQVGNQILQTCPGDKKSGAIFNEGFLFDVSDDTILEIRGIVKTGKSNILDFFGTKSRRRSSARSKMAMLQENEAENEFCSNEDTPSSRRNTVASSMLSSIESVSYSDEDLATALLGDSGSRKIETVSSTSFDIKLTGGHYFAGSYYLKRADNQSLVGGEISIQVALFIDGFTQTDTRKQASILNVADWGNAILYEDFLTVYIANAPPALPIWRRHFFVLQGKKLLAYDFQQGKSKELMGSIDISTIYSVSKADPDRMNVSNCIQLDMESGKMFAYADTKQQMINWMRKLVEAISRS